MMFLNKWKNLVAQTFFSKALKQNIVSKCLFNTSSVSKAFSIDTTFDSTNISNVDKNRITVTRQITYEDVLNFSKLTGDYNPIHSEGGLRMSSRPVVHGSFLNGLVSGVIGTKLPGPGTVVISQTIRYPNFCYAGETIAITVVITSPRKIVKCNYKCVTVADNKIVMDGEARLLMTNKVLKNI